MEGGDGEGGEVMTDSANGGGRREGEGREGG